VTQERLHLVCLFESCHFFEKFEIAKGINFYQIQFSQFLSIPFIPIDKNAEFFNCFYDL